MKSEYMNSFLVDLCHLHGPLTIQMDKGLVRWAKTAGKSRQGQSVTASRGLNGLREGG